MTQIDIAYRGELRCEASHPAIGASLVTDVLADSGGRGERFSPTDLLAAALGTCMLSTLAIVADRQGLDIGGATITVTKEANDKHQISRLAAEIHVPLANLDDTQRRRLERGAHACPVHRSLHPELDAPITIIFG